MSSTISSLDEAFAIAQSLKPAEKLELISRLWESVRQSGGFRPSDADLQEVKRRWAEFEAGREKAIPWETVWAEVEREQAHDE